MPNIIIKGIMTVKRFGTKNNDKQITFKTSICIKLVNVNNRVNCNNHDIDKNIKKIRVQDFTI